MFILSMDIIVLGQIRTTVCQAKLLIRKKLQQYLGLVAIAENQSGERETTSEDLQVRTASYCVDTVVEQHCVHVCAFLLISINQY